jgi:saccharopine dehydrogenase-like NADP-dependent oxidoreductase
MTSILIVGAGKSATVLIDTLLQNTEKKNNPWKVIVADNDEATLKLKTQKYPNAEIAVLDINDETQRQRLVKSADLVLSLMPAHLHILLAKDCLQFKKNLITSSYASEEMRELHDQAQKAGLMFMCEMGLDPGIDHMSASSIFDSIRKVASDIESFKSYCGGLIAPESDDNPWHYKFSWNPKNVINAGKDGAHYLEDGQPIHLTYDKLFAHNDKIFCQGVGELAYYANRDSLSYIELYGLQEAKNFMRATLRYPEFCQGWNALIGMGLTNTQNEVNTANISYKDWIKEVVGYSDTSISVEEFVWRKLGLKNANTKKMLQWLDLFSEKKIGAGLQSSGDILLSILSEKWQMKPEDKDMVVMQHELIYKHKNESNKLISSMVVKGDNSDFSAMAKTVGLPIAILTELLVNNGIRYPKGVVIPTMSEIYRPVLLRLEKYGIEFTETVTTI